MEDDDNDKEEQTESRDQNEKEKRVLELLKDVPDCKSKSRRWMKKIPAKNQFLDPINKKLKPIQHAKNDIVNNLAEKNPHKIFDQYVNDELKLKTFEETNRNAAQKNVTTSVNVEVLKTFNLILLLTG